MNDSTEITLKCYNIVTPLPNVVLHFFAIALGDETRLSWKGKINVTECAYERLPKTEKKRKWVVMN